MVVVPSYLRKSFGSTPDVSGHELRFRETTLRTGEVIAIYPPTDKNNVSKKYYEYKVSVFLSSALKPFDIKTYDCVMMDAFGSVADSLQYTPRLSTQNAQVDRGSFVLVLCNQGDTQQGVIIGAYPNPNLPTVQDQTDLGHHLSFEFNGVLVDIDKDGALSIQRFGATDEDGSVMSDYSSGGGNSITMDKDGNVLVQAGGDKDVSIELKATGEINLKSVGNVSVDCGTGSGLVVNSGSHPIIKGDTFLTDLMKMLGQIVPATAAAMNVAAPGSGVPLVQSFAEFSGKISTYLSTANKVD